MKININGKMVEVDNDILSKAIEDKTESIEVKADFVMRTKAEDELFTTNLKKESTKIGAEIGRKEVIKGLGIETDGSHKSDTTSIESIKEWSNGMIKQSLLDAKIEPNKKLEERDSDILTLKGTIKGLEEKNSTLGSDFSSFKKTQTIQNSLSSLIPDNAILPREDMMSLISNKIKVDVNEHGQVFGIGADGNPLKNSTTLELTPLKEIVGTFFAENTQYTKGASGGAGGGDSRGADATQSIEKFIEEMADNNTDPNSPEFLKQMEERMSAGTLKV